MLPTGLAIALPSGYAAFVHPRSGLAARAGLGWSTRPGTIDAGYRGEIKVIVINHDTAPPAAAAPRRADRPAGRPAGRAGRLRRGRRAAGLRARRRRARLHRRRGGAARLEPGDRRTDRHARRKDPASAGTTQAEAHRRVEDRRDAAVGDQAPRRARRDHRARTTSGTRRRTRSPRVDLGALRIPVGDGFDVRVDLDEASRSIVGDPGQRRRARCSSACSPPRATRASGTRSAPRSPSR